MDSQNEMNLQLFLNGCGTRLLVEDINKEPVQRNNKMLNIKMMDGFLIDFLTIPGDF
jgi:hypothetical protein